MGLQDMTDRYKQEILCFRRSIPIRSRHHTGTLCQPLAAPDHGRNKGPSFDCSTQITVLLLSFCDSSTYGLHEHLEYKPSVAKYDLELTCEPLEAHQAVSNMARTVRVVGVMEAELDIRRNRVV